MLSHISKSMQVFNSEAIIPSLMVWLSKHTQKKVCCYSHFDLLWMKHTTVVTTTFDPPSPDRHTPNKINSLSPDLGLYLKLLGNVPGLWELYMSVLSVITLSLFVFVLHEIIGIPSSTICLIFNNQPYG